MAASRFSSDVMEMFYGPISHENKRFKMDEMLTYEQLKDYFVKMCDEAEQYFSDSSKELTLFKGPTMQKKTSDFSQKGNWKLWLMTKI